MAFATTDEVQIRLGGTTLTAGQIAQAELLIELATSILADNIGRDDEWAAALDPVPGIVRAVVLEAVARVMQNPAGARSESETLGAYSHSTSYTDGAHGLSLFDAEMRLCRTALLGGSSASAQVPSLITELATGTRDPPASDTADDLYDWID